MTKILPISHDETPSLVSPHIIYLAFENDLFSQFLFIPIFPSWWSTVEYEIIILRK